MIWEDKGYLISKNKYSENSVIANFFTKNHGKVSGVVYGATSKKNRNYLLVGNKFHLNYNSKNDGKSGYFKIEIDEIKTPIYLDNKKKLSSIIYVMNILKILTNENQENKNIFFLIEDYFNFLPFEKWLKEFVFWELNLFKIIGYDLNLKDYVSSEKIDGINKYVVKKNHNNKIIPDFLIDKKVEPKNIQELLIALKIIGDFLEKTILKPNNIGLPISRIDFLNLLK